MSEEPNSGSGAEVSRRAFVGLTAGAVAVAAAGAAVGIGLLTEEKKATKLTSKYVAGDIPVDDPQDGRWYDLNAFDVTMLPQQMVAPMIQQVVVPTLRVRSMNNGETIAFHLEWEDAELDAKDSMAMFHDGVAVQLPTTETAPAVSMGQPGSPVHIMQWRASWQADIDEGRRTVKDIFPNFHPGLAPEDLMTEEQANVYYPGIYVGNPMSKRSRTSPIEELTAVGFGSLTEMDEQKAVGNGVYEGGSWKVAMGTSMLGGEGRYDGSRKTKVAFAAWNGSQEERGARKQYADWIDISIEGGGG